MRGWRRRRVVAHPPLAESSRLVEQCSAFLSGSLARERALHGEAPHAWEWVNLLAHGSEEQLRDLAGRSGGGAGDFGDPEWHMAVGFLAATVLDQTEHGNLSLASLQRSALVPLELEMARSPDFGEKPEVAVRAVLAAIRRVLRLHPDSAD